MARIERIKEVDKPMFAEVEYIDYWINSIKNNLLRDMNIFIKIETSNI
jgi:hypothetical protein